MDQTPAALMPSRPAIPPGPFTVDEYDQLIRDGIFDLHRRVELIEGELVWMSPIGSPHASAVAGLNAYFSASLGNRVLVWVQNPIRLGDRSEPEPDVVLLRPRPDRYRSGHPGPEDILLVIEVADTTLDYDRSVKGPLYARHGIGEYWIVNLNDELVEVHLDPGPNGYGTVEPFGLDSILTVTALPGLRVPVREFLP